MLEIIINDKPVTLNPKSKLSLKIRNPLFNSQGTFSYPLSAPLEPNRVVFEHADQLDNPQVPSLKFQMKVNGEELMDGDVGLTDIVNNFEFYIKSGKSAIAYKLRNTYMNEEGYGISWGENEAGFSGIELSINKTYPESPFTIAPIKLSDDVVNQIDPTTNKLYYEKTQLPVLPTHDKYIYMSIKETFPHSNIEPHYKYKATQVVPLVHVRYLLKRLANSLGLRIERDDLEQHPDFNRLVICAPTYFEETINHSGFLVERECKVVKKDFYNSIKNFLPAITVSEFLTDIYDRFNICFYVNELNASVEIILADSVFTMPTIDYTDKFISDEDCDPAESTVITFENTGEDDQSLSNTVLSEKYEFINVQSIDDISTQIRVLKIIPPMGPTYATQKYFHTVENDKYYEVKYLTIESDIKKQYFLTLQSNFVYEWLDGSYWGGRKAYQLSEETSINRGESAMSDEITVVGVAGVYTSLFWVIMPEVDNVLIDNVTIKDLVLKTDLAVDVTIKATAYIAQKNGVLVELGSTKFIVKNTAYRQDENGNDLESSADYPPVLNDVYIPIFKTSDIDTDVTSGMVNDDDTEKRVMINIEFIHETTRTVSAKFWSRAESVMWWETQVCFDYDRPIIEEMNSLKPYFIGDLESENSEKVSPKSKIPTMCCERMGGYLFQMPKLEMKATKNIKDFAYLLVRPNINDEIFGSYYAPFAGSDVLDMNGKNYTERLNVDYTPTISLYWNGINGIINQFHKNTVKWKSLYKRKVRKRLKLNLSDIINNRLYHPITIGSEQFIINEIASDIIADGDLGDAIVEMFTV